MAQIHNQAQGAGSVQQGAVQGQPGGYHSPPATPRGDCPGAPKPNRNKLGGQGGGLPLPPQEHLDLSNNYSE